MVDVVVRDQDKLHHRVVGEWEPEETFCSRCGFLACKAERGTFPHETDAAVAVVIQLLFFVVGYPRQKLRKWGAVE